MRQIVLDTETTGLSFEEGHRIIEIGCVELVHRRYTGNRFHQYVNPEREIELGALQVHGISKEFLINKPTFREVAKELIDFITGAELIIHNAPFDIGFLDHELKLIDKSFKPISSYCSVFDTLTFARKKHPAQQNNLDALCKRYQVDNSNRDLHGALLDAKLLAEVYLAMTGGQTNLFSEERIDKSPEKIKTQIYVSGERIPLPVIYANVEEQQAHYARLEAIKKANGGRAIWEN
jgi:DNA polymerase-3 subunit epsilon